MPPVNVLNTITLFVDALKKAGVKIIAAYLYGSYANNRATPESDIDVAIVSGDFSGDSLADWELVCKIRRPIDIRIEAIPFRPENFRDENQSVLNISLSGDVQIYNKGSVYDHGN